jgi:hypothetical protein
MMPRKARPTAAHGQTDDRHFRDAERLQKPVAVQRDVMKVVGDDRLRGAAEADLVWRHDPKALFAQNLDRTGKVKSAEVHPVE